MLHVSELLRLRWIENIVRGAMYQHECGLVAVNGGIAHQKPTTALH